MEFSASRNKLNCWILLLPIIVAIAGLSGVLYHTTHCDTDHGRCHICLLITTLIIFGAFSVVLFLCPCGIFRLVDEHTIDIYIAFFILTRAPPMSLFIATREI